MPWFRILRYILDHFDISIIMDADALNHISKDLGLFPAYEIHSYNAPSGEMARLTGMDIEEITNSPIDCNKLC